MEAILQKIEQKLFERQSVEVSFEDYSFKYSEAKKEEAKLESSIVLNNKALTVLQTVYEKINDMAFTQVCALMTGALNQIFPDRTFEVVHNVVTERGVNQLNFYLKEVKPDGTAIRSNIRNSTGGSIRAITGLICSLFYIVKMKGVPFLAIDEGMSQIEDDHVEDMFNMMKSFGKEAGFMFIMVTHDNRFTPYADRIYWVENGTMKQIKG